LSPLQGGVLRKKLKQIIMIDDLHQANEKMKYIMIMASLMALPAMNCYRKQYGNEG